MKRIYVSGHNGMTGRALLRKLSENSDYEIITIDHDALDLEKRDDVYDFVRNGHFDTVVLIAAAVGGIKANAEHELDFLCKNLDIGLNVVRASFESHVPELINISSAAVYSSALDDSSIDENCFYRGPFAAGTEGYSLAKLSVLKLCEFINRFPGYNYISLIPTNIYGPHDNFQKLYSHVIAAMLLKFDEAVKFNNDTVTLWGNGEAEREFLYVDDLASAISMLITSSENISYPYFNISSGESVSIKQLAELIREIVGYKGEIVWDESMPTGVRRRVIDSTRLKDIGWRPTVFLRDGLEKTYLWFKEAGLLRL